MKRLFILIFFSSFCFVGIFSQNFKGKVLNASGQPVAGSSVYIEENKQGLICNAEGEFQTTLPAGEYRCFFSCLGYESLEKEISIRKDAASVVLEIILKEKDIELKEIVIDNSGEDPAYEIMRKAIEKAPFYLNQVKEYTCEAYIKGSGKSTNIPKLIEKIGGEELTTLKDKLFLQESFNEVKYVAPDKYEQTVKAFSSSMPNDTLPEYAFSAVTGSLYRPMFMGMVSPLHPKAFSYYKFRYEGYDEVDGEIINKIKVIPKLKDRKFTSGYLYIADERWNIRHAELVGNISVATIDYVINYSRIAENVYLATSYTEHVDANAMGFRFYMDYSSSLKYTDILLNDSLIASQVNLNPEKKKEKKSLEIKSSDFYKHRADSLAAKRDSSYWSTVRSVVLNEEEIRSYIRKDTLQTRMDSLKQVKLHPKFRWTDALTGGNLGGDSSKVSFKYGGMIGAWGDYNFVDGFLLGQSVELGVKRKTGSRWKINPRAYWATARRQLVWDMSVDLTYAPLRLGKLSFSGGSVSEDYSGSNGMNRLINLSYVLFDGNNKAKFYQKDYFNIGNRIDLANGLQMDVSVEAAHRQALDNHTSYSFFGNKDDVKPNVPNYPGDLNSQYDRLLEYAVLFRYTPEYYYEIFRGEKRYVRSRFPTFQLRFKNGLPSGEHYSKFYRLDAAVSQTVKTGLFDQFNYLVMAGAFLNSNDFNYIDYKHFNTSDRTLITAERFGSSYTLLPYYTYSTSDKWMQVFVNYGTQYLLLKRVPFLQGKLFFETLHARYLWTPRKKHYTEWGYSVGLPAGLGSAGIFVSFDSFDYNGWGVSFSLPLLQEFGIRR